MSVVMSSLTAVHQKSRVSVRSLTLCAFYTNTKWPASHRAEARCQLKLVLKWANSPVWHWGPGENSCSFKPITSHTLGEIFSPRVCIVKHTHLCARVCTIYFFYCVLPLTRVVFLPPYLIMMLQSKVVWLQVSCACVMMPTLMLLPVVDKVLINLKISGHLSTALLLAEITSGY